MPSSKVQARVALWGTRIVSKFDEYIKIELFTFIDINLVSDIS